MGRILNRIGWMSLLNACVFISLMTFVEFSGYADKLRITPDLNHVTIGILCLIWGMVGSVLTLLISSPLIKWRVGAHRLRAGGPDDDVTLVLETFEDIARQMGFKRPPKLAVYLSDEKNAFAVGLWGGYSSVCVSSGLLYGITRQQLVGALAHELAHIKNGDMITFTLMQGFVNSIVLFAVRASAFVGAKVLGKFSAVSVILYYVFFIFFQIIFGLLASVVLSHFSRRREYRADRDAAACVGSESVLSTLELLSTSCPHDTGPRSWFSACKIHEAPLPKTSIFAPIFASHPPLYKRIARVQAAAQNRPPPK